ncbi:hypothetical protein OBBRIDRAFT_815867 [Obba rivulosa]|uniref:RBR-type E3 ubiquitin transferase n=1 Tax=Obba rivulosa TaxID=1052685 RepID=A0A8E2J7K2_9APHY|nr:hypothetical protein OBBRIDRAFT_815867 [Obba rivulosa]
MDATSSSLSSTRRHARYFQPADEFSSLFTYIAQLGVEGIDELESRSAGKRRAPLSDEELALQLFVEEAQSLLSVTKEFLVGSTADYHGSRALVDELIAMEEMARLDHEMAVALSEGRDPPPRLPPIAVSRSPLLKDVADIVSEGRNESDNDSSNDTPPPSHPSSPTPSTSTLASDSTPTSPTVSVASLPEDTAIPSKVHETCTACGDDINDTTLTTPCGHSYDVSCIEAMFRMATVDESAFPPRCCQQTIPLADVRKHLPSRLVSNFETKSIEFSTPSRVYCHRAACSKFLGARTPDAASVACSACFAATCGSCTQEAHPGQGCSARLDQPVLALAKEQKWQRCPTCQHLVELTVGCYHIICVCKGQFCYLCGDAWKKCSCPQFAVPPELQE